MTGKLLHTPEGVRDIYNDDCTKKLYLEKKLSDVLLGYGFNPIETPSFEYFDIFANDLGTVPSSDLYKFFDKAGDTLCLRPDITPSVARAAAKYYMEKDVPIRFYYCGNRFINHHSLQGRLKECTQLGAELMGETSVESDGEIIALTAEALLASGLKDFQISVGHTGILKGLIDEAKLDDETITKLKKLISNKNYFGVEELADSLEIDEKLKACFYGLGKIYKDAKALKELKEAAANYPVILSAVNHLLELEKILLLYGVENFVSYEPGMISEHDYYTGIIFAGYTYQSGEPVATGGRYDSLLGHFGKDRASVGFAVIIDVLMNALIRQGIEIPVTHNTKLLVYDEAHLEDAIVTAKKERAVGKKVCLMKLESEEKVNEYASLNNITQITYLR